MITIRASEKTENDFAFIASNNGVKNGVLFDAIIEHIQLKDVALVIARAKELESEKKRKKRSDCGVERAPYSERKLLINGEKMTKFQIENILKQNK